MLYYFELNTCIITTVSGVSNTLTWRATLAASLIYSWCYHFIFHRSTRSSDTPGWLQSLECAEEDDRFFLILEKYEDIKTFLLIIALMITLLYFITSFDSAALVLGTISSNGKLWLGQYIHLAAVSLYQ